MNVIVAEDADAHFDLFRGPGERVALNWAERELAEAVADLQSHDGFVEAGSILRLCHGRFQHGRGWSSG